MCSRCDRVFSHSSSVRRPLFRVVRALAHRRHATARDNATMCAAGQILTIALSKCSDTPYKTARSDKARLKASAVSARRLRGGLLNGLRCYTATARVRQGRITPSGYVVLFRSIFQLLLRRTDERGDDVRVERGRHFVETDGIARATAVRQQRHKAAARDLHQHLLTHRRLVGRA